MADQLLASVATAYFLNQVMVFIFTFAEREQVRDKRSNELEKVSLRPAREGRTSYPWVQRQRVPWPRHQTLATRGNQNQLTRWNRYPVQPFLTVRVHVLTRRPGRSVPDGRRAVSASRDRTLRLWDLESGEEIVAFTGEDEMRCCALTPDGRTIVAGDASGQEHFLRLIEADPTKPQIGETKIQLLQHKQPGNGS